MFIKSVADRTETSGLVYVTLGTECDKNASEEFALSASEWKKICAVHELMPLSEVSEETYDILHAAAERTASVRRAAALLSSGDKSAREIKTKLKLSGISSEAADYAVNFLTKRGYLNETSQCERIASFLLRSKRYGKQRIISYLISRGYTSENAKAAAASLDDDDVTEALQINIEKKFPKIAEFSQPEIKKAVAALMRLGFSTSEIFAEIRRMKENKD